MMQPLLVLSALVVSALAACPKLPPVAGVSAMAKNYPPLGQIAKIMPGDAEVRRPTLYSCL